MAGIHRLNTLLGAPSQPTADNALLGAPSQPTAADWANRVIPQAIGSAPLIYRDSPWMPQHPDDHTDSEWTDRVWGTAQQVPQPEIYSRSPWMPRQPDYSVAGRVYHPNDVLRMQRYWRETPIIQSEEGDYYIHVPKKDTAPPVAPFSWMPWWARWWAR
jgi:hypothetical protein